MSRAASDAAPAAAARHARALAARILLRDGVRRPAAPMVLDALAWIVAVPIAVALAALSTAPVGGVLVPLVAAALVLAHLGVGHVAGLFRGWHGVGSLEEVARMAAVACVAGVVVGAPLLVLAPLGGLPRAGALVATPLAIVLMAGTRLGLRLLLERSQGPAGHAPAALILGAGYVGTHLARRMRTDAHSPLRVVGLVDDDPRLVGATRSGVRVLGTRRDLRAIAARTGATRLVVAIARADAALLADVEAQAAPLGLQVVVPPPFAATLGGGILGADLRRVRVEDVMGRRPVSVDVDRVADAVAGRRVLVTGAGGSIGAELCRQLARCRPAELVMLDHDESSLQSVQLDVHGNGLLSSRDLVLADVRDAAAIDRVFAERRPHVVFHAAALKHLPMLEQYPDEAWKTNVLGTRSVLAAAEASGVETFVTISTDKAANPTSVLGHSKRIAERLTAATAQHAAGRYLSVRFGNVLGSRGSMVPLFAALIESGGPVTVTHPDVTRYVMSIAEACGLVVQAAAIGRPGEVLILDMGEPVRILDVARRMIAMSGKDVDIVFTGLRPHEKLHEELIGPDEHGERREHPRITHVAVPPLAHAELDEPAWHARWRLARADDARAGAVVGSAPAADAPIRPRAER